MTIQNKEKLGWLESVPTSYSINLVCSDEGELLEWYLLPTELKEFLTLTFDRYESYQNTPSE